MYSYFRVMLLSFYVFWMQVLYSELRTIYLKVLDYQDYWIIINPFKST